MVGHASWWAEGSAASDTAAVDSFTSTASASWCTSFLGWTVPLVVYAFAALLVPSFNPLAVALVTPLEVPLVVPLVAALAGSSW